jgi:hypothetical protein
MRIPVSACLALATVAALAACGTVAAPAGGPHAHPADPTPAIPGPPGGSRAEAAALAGQVLARLQLPAGTRRLPPMPVPPSLREPALGPATGDTSFDLPQFFVVPQPMDALEAGLAAHAPVGMGQGGTGRGSGDNGPFLEVTYLVQSVPAGIASAQIVLTVVPAGSGGSLLRADAQILWFPSRSAAEHIDPGRYHVLTIDATIWGQRVYTVHKIVTSQAFIARIAQALNRSPAQPPVTIACPSDSETYRLALSVSRRSRPVVVISAAESGCGGSGVTVNGQPQPALDDQGAVGALAHQALAS